MYERLVPAALKAYGLGEARIFPVQKGYRNEIYPIIIEGRHLQLTFYKSEPGIKERIERADAVSHFAAKKGLPVRRRANDRTLVFTSDKRTIYVGLYDYLPGQTIAWESYTKRHLKELGKTLSNLHFSLRDFDISGHSSVIDEVLELNQRMERYFNGVDVQAAMREKLSLELEWDFDRTAARFHTLRELASSQLHMDFVRGNVLFNDSEITGILDFEKTAYGPPIVDVARTLAFLLVDCKYKTEHEVRKYFLESGYHKRGSAQLDYYPNVLEFLIRFFLLYDFYKFLRHNPYESLKDNEHYQRTVSILSQSGVLHYT